MSRILFFCLCCVSSVSFSQTAPACPSLQLQGWSMTIEQGEQIGLAIMALFCVAGIWRVLIKSGPSDDN